MAPALPIARVPTGNAAWHLHDRKQRIHAVQGLRFDGHAEYRQHGLRSRHSRQMSRPAGTSNQHFEAAAFRRTSILEQQIGCAMSRDDADFKGYAECGQRFSDMRIVAQSLREPMMTPTSGCMTGSN